MSRKVRRSMLVALALAVMLIGISLVASAEQLAKQITMWHTYTQPARVEAMQKMAEEFEKETGIKVNIKVMTWPGVTEKWPMAYAAGTLPDILTCVTTDAVAMWAVGASAPVNNVIDALGGPDEFIAYLDQWNDNGQYIAYPFYGLSRLLTYRKSWLEEIGMAPPDTWDEFLKAAVALTKPPKQYGFIQLLSKADYGLTTQFYPLVYNLGGKFWDEDLNPTLNTPEVIEAAKFMKQLYDGAHPAGAMNYNVSDTYRLWNSGLTAFSFEGIPVQVGAYEEAPEVFEDTGVTYIPRPSTTPPEKRTNYTAPRVMVLVNKPEPIRRAAEKFMIFINQHERKLEFLHTFPFMMPVQRALVEDPRFIADDPILSKMKDNVEMTFIGMKIGITGGMESGINPYGFLLERDTIEPMFQRIYLENVSIEKAVADTQARLARRVEEQKQLMGW